MYGSDNALECEWCKVKDATVRKREVRCADEGCRCDYEAIVCEECAKRANE